MLFKIGAKGRIKTPGRRPTAARITPLSVSGANLRAQTTKRVLLRAAGRKKNINLGISY